MTLPVETMLLTLMFPAREAMKRMRSGVRMLFLSLLVLPACLAVKAVSAADAPELPSVKQSPEVLAAMRQVHAGFKGQAGYVAQFGDSITYSMAFWSAMSWDDPDKYLPADDGLPQKPGDRRWKDVILGARDKGGKFANYSGWRVGQLLKSVDEVLQRERPEYAIIMIGTNDISGGKLPANYEQDLQQVVQKCLDAHCIPILNTIPPRQGKDDAVAAANTVIRKTAEQMSVPLADFHAACVRLRPGDSWQNSIISKDGVHPSGGKTNVYTVENMQNCGYALRNWVNFLALRELYFAVQTK
ncbi:SGNH/GDSL hydrolase family protein [Lignipirellula cremea]|uniref:SGNH/GDSL hydrolase family protein n=1 Tax=Lignipirellula cremea TaxID=2528010 RepID=UPI001E40B0E7|nr:SGNH/GDSL hydrolase family protein [Lignipirellula cremea]